MARPPNTPNDPERRRRILDATMDLLEESGIASVTARSVATRARVPVGSVSYHFESVNGLLLRASHDLLGQRVSQITGWETGRENNDDAGPWVLRRLAELIHYQVTTGRGLTVVAYELYLLGLRDPGFREISSHTVGVLQEKLEEHFPVERAAHLAATAEGLQLQSLFAEEPPTVESLLTTLERSDHP